MYENATYNSRGTIIITESEARLHERAQHDAPHRRHLRRAMRRDAAQEGVHQRHHRANGKEPQDVLLPLREQGLPYHVDLPLRPRSGAQTPLPRKHARIRDRCDRLLRAVPLLHPAEVGRALARSRRVLRLLRPCAGSEAQLLHPGSRRHEPLLAAQLPVPPVPARAAQRHRPHLGEPLPAPGEHPVLGRVLHLRVSVLLHPQVRPARR